MRLALVLLLLAVPILFQVGLRALRQRRRAAGGTARLEGRLRESEEHLGRLAEEARDYAVFRLDREGRIASWNPGAERLFGRRAGEVLGRAVALLQPPDDVRSGRLDRDLALARAQGSLREEAWMAFKDGRQFRASVALTAAGEPPGAGFICVVHDLTERMDAEARVVAMARDLQAQVAARTREVQESEARIQSFIRHAPAALAVKGLDGRLLLVNRKAEALIGMCQAATPDACLERLFPPASFALGRAQDEEVLTRRRLVQVEESVRLADGSVRDYLIQKFPLVDVHSRCWGLGVIATNITERKQLEQANLQRQKVEALGHLAAGLAHDFNNLLGAMLGHVELARLELGPLEHLRVLDELLGRASGLVAQVLAYAGLGRTQVQVMDLNQQVEEQVRPLRASLDGRTALRWEPGPDLPPMDGDAAQIRQVIANLVLNAREAMDREGGVITLRTSLETLGPEAVEGPCQGQALEPGPHLVLEVSDNGPGMPEDVLDRIFDPFYSTKGVGRGLGLSVVRGVLQSHRGGIQVRSGPGSGTTFRLLFPVSGQAVPEASAREDEGFPAYRATGTALVVDDEDAVRAVAVQVLRKLGMETLEARDGLEALAVFESAWDRIRLILLDITMPGMGGEETFRELRRAGALAPIVLSSGFDRDEALKRFSGMALAGFLQKPYRLASLVRTIREALEGAGAAPGLRPSRELVAWLPEYELGHPILDAQHKGLVKAFNHLVAATEGGEPSRAFASLVEFMTVHFRDEEAILGAAGWYGTAEHKVVQAAQLERFQDHAGRLARGEEAFTKAFLDLVEDDLLNTIQVEVLQLSGLFRGGGLKGSA